VRRVSLCVICMEGVAMCCVSAGRPCDGCSCRSGGAGPSQGAPACADRSSSPADLVCRQLRPAAAQQLQCIGGRQHPALKPTPANPPAIGGGALFAISDVNAAILVDAIRCGVNRSSAGACSGFNSMAEGGVPAMLLSASSSNDFIQ
jgi:hypothetical protein